MESDRAEVFRQAYQGQPPWDVGHAQRALVEIAPRIKGSILDVGCGTGDNAIFFAQRGHSVYGIDIIEAAIERARSKARDRGVSACFLVLDALELHRLPIQFDNVIDCGFFHVLEDQDRQPYADSLSRVLRPGGHVWMMCFSDEEPPGHGPRRISRHELHETFDEAWQIRSIEPVQFETSPHVAPGTFSPGGPQALRVVLQRPTSDAACGPSP